MRKSRFVAGLVVAIALAAAVASGRAQPVRYEHRVVVPTTARLFDSDISGSLERNVNALAARGYELTAIVGGDAAAIDAMLTRRPYSRIGADDAGVALAVMARPVDGPRIARQYRLLHVRELEAVEKVIAPLGPEGYRLKLTEFDGGVTHVVFERVEGASPVEFREFRNKFRRTWMDQLLADPDVRARMRRVTPLTLGAGIVELGPPQPTPGDVSWLSKPTHAFEQLEDRIRDMVKTGHTVQMVRRRGPNDLDVLMVKPAGASAATASYDLDDGPWGMACSRGTIAGAAVGPDGDVYCAVDQSGASPASNRGLDLTVRPQPTVAGAVLFRGPTCAIEARLRSSRPASKRVAFALQFEQEIARALEPGYRAVRALAAVDHNGQARIVVFTSNGAAALPAGAAPAEPSPAPPLVAELDSITEDLERQREAAINTELAAGPPEIRDLWVELAAGPLGSANLLGCVRTRLDARYAETAVNGVMTRKGLGHIRVANRLVIER